MIHKYLCSYIGQGTEEDPYIPSICSIYTGNWGSQSGTTDTTIIVVADTTEIEHLNILTLEDVSEITE